MSCPVATRIAQLGATLWLLVAACQASTGSLSGSGGDRDRAGGGDTVSGDDADAAVVLGDATGADLDGCPAFAAVTGTVSASGGGPVAGARVTLLASGGAFFEARTDAGGAYRIDGVPSGAYQAGASALRRAYVEVTLNVDLCGTADFVLGPETEPGRWSVVGDTNPDYFPAGTPSGSLLPDGRVFYCHDTLDPVVFDPVTGDKSYPVTSGQSQGCHMTTVLGDGRLLFVGGQDPQDPGSFTNGIKYVKAWVPSTNTWDFLPNLKEARWYPTLVRLADDRLLACGGGQPPYAQRTATCEIRNPIDGTWDYTGSLANATEYSPSALLLSGEVLTTWYPPQLFNPTTGQWRATGNFVQTARGFPNHSVHALVLLADGDALAVGIQNGGTSMLERYDAVQGAWAMKASPETLRTRPETVLLPDGRVLAAGGELAENDSTVEVNAWGRVRLADLYDPDLDSWRSVAPMALAREYHALTVLVPDGRVLTTSGTGNQSSGSAPENSIEAFEPPYLFRGPRPRIESLSTTTLSRGGTMTIRVSRTSSPTGVLLLGTMTETHWMNGGVPRFARLSFTRLGDTLDVSLPASANALPNGYYILFVMVDDIPSVGRIVRAG